MICDAAGVMYWGDASLDKIERANLNGSGRTVLLREDSVHYFSFVFNDGSIYFTDWLSVYVPLLHVYFQQ